MAFAAVGFITGTSAPVTATDPRSTDWSNERLAATTLSCNGVLIASRTVLTAASCLATDPMKTCFALNPTGDALAHPDQTMVYAIDGAHLSPGGEAILHLAVASGQPEPASLAAPIAPRTASDANPSPYGVHTTLARVPGFGGDPSPSVMVSWSIENGPTIVRHTRVGVFGPALDGGIQFTAGPPSSSDLGAPALVPDGSLVLGILTQFTASPTVLPTFSTDEGTWLEQMLWRYDEVVVPVLAPPAPPGNYSWFGMADLRQDPPSLQEPYPQTFYVAGSEPVVTGTGTSTRTYGICITWSNGAQVPGKFWLGGPCSYDSNGNETWPSVLKVLNLTGTSSWVQASGGSIPAGSFAAGYEGQTPLYTCRAPYMNGIQPGVVRQGTCYVEWGGQQLTYTDFETLVLGP